MNDQISEVTAQELIRLIRYYGWISFSLGKETEIDNNSEECNFAINEVENVTDQLMELINSLVPANK